MTTPTKTGFGTPLLNVSVDELMAEQTQNQSAPMPDGVFEEIATPSAEDYARAQQLFMEEYVERQREQFKADRAAAVEEYQNSGHTYAPSEDAQRTFLIDYDDDLIRAVYPRIAQVLYDLEVVATELVVRTQEEIARAYQKGHPRNFLNVLADLPSMIGPVRPYIALSEWQRVRLATARKKVVALTAESKGVPVEDVEAQFRELTENEKTNLERKWEARRRTDLSGEINRSDLTYDVD